MIGYFLFLLREIYSFFRLLCNVIACMFAIIHMRKMRHK